ncbi:MULTISPECIES: Shedu immune nuclease family protein [unclassified Colwellia]|uniref:Shedu immune nuclease family protein n=1 Tax=unclassified Colwellia TaxID=196834 RepID=UPI0015F641F4|nr:MULTISPECIES: Shedu immune nuclease family protein [unclassified Colwellia]MBA6380523.1 DUF4263 domain-containing protein [Colwellia sp. BRX10-7]MBA6388050.1 DUF4263 domain-containing protein [Colwellia sp. BRX10-2]MBA6403049.1 DUF4263 domain-containing protein [Colwellia sp. BRX10-5]MBA6405970.1 DUF4263 domain-containing protein [Colwellia sp. BRX10-1]
MYWWVNQSTSFSKEVEGGYIWSPQTLSGGIKSYSFDCMKKVSIGDVIFSYSKGEIRAVGITTTTCIDSDHPLGSELCSTKPVPTKGWLIKVDWEVLENTIRPKDNIIKIAPLLPDKYSPIQKNGNGNQGVYLAPISEDLASVLKESIAIHHDVIESLIGNQNEIDIVNISEMDLEEVVSICKGSLDVDKEEYWHMIFEKHPTLLNVLLPTGMKLRQSKCYLGGKKIDNKGGNIIDFLFISNKSKNSVLIEIKTPKTKLLGKKYRDNAYSIHEELSGGVVQTLNYKNELLMNYKNLLSGEDEDFFNAFNPRCILLVGSYESISSCPIKKKSFELFRSSLAGVEIVTYDELLEQL